MGKKKKSSSAKGKPLSAKARRYRRNQRIVIGVFSFLMILIVCVGGVAAKVLTDVASTMNTVHEEVETSDYRSLLQEEDESEEDESEEDSSTEESSSEEESSEESSEETELIDEAEPIAILIIGSDTDSSGRTSANGLSDVLIYCVLNPNTETMSLLSIPRDTYCQIVGYGVYGKINTAYSYGGATMCINTVQNLLNLPVDYYAAVNFDGFEALIDAIGGITVTNSFSFSYDGHYFPAGTVTLDGEEALAFCRMRKNDPEGDFGRNRRQRNVITAIAKKIVTLSTALNYQSLLSAVEANMTTNIDLDSALTMISNYSCCLNNINNYDTLEGYSYNNGKYYYMLDEDNLAEVTAELRAELELD